MKVAIKAFENVIAATAVIAMKVNQILERQTELLLGVIFHGMTAAHVIIITKVKTIACIITIIPLYSFQQ
jgi:hypothetical protein